MSCLSWHRVSFHLICIWVYHHNFYYGSQKTMTDSNEMVFLECYPSAFLSLWARWGRPRKTSPASSLRTAALSLRIPALSMSPCLKMNDKQAWIPQWPQSSGKAVGRPWEQQCRYVRIRGDQQKWRKQLRHPEQTLATCMGLLSHRAEWARAPRPSTKAGLQPGPQTHLLRCSAHVPSSAAAATRSETGQWGNRVGEGGWDEGS